MRHRILDCHFKGPLFRYSDSPLQAMFLDFEHGVCEPQFLGVFSFLSLSYSGGGVGPKTGGVSKVLGV